MNQVETIKNMIREYMASTKSGGIYLLPSDCKIILKALEQEPCEDCISRQDAKAEIRKAFPSLADRIDINSILNELPSVQPKTGHWSHDGSHWKNRFICSECGYKLFEEPTNYCPNCGARMVDQESEGKE